MHSEPDQTQQYRENPCPCRKSNLGRPTPQPLTVLTELSQLILQFSRREQATKTHASRHGDSNCYGSFHMYGVTAKPTQLLPSEKYPRADSYVNGAVSTTGFTWRKWDRWRLRAKNASHTSCESLKGHLPRRKSRDEIQLWHALPTTVCTLYKWTLPTMGSMSQKRAY
jgi:hypothetical protein